MDGYKAIEELARHRLTVAMESGRQDVALWEHTLRVVNLSERILAMPEVPANRVDRIALRTAILCHDLGLAIEHQEGKVENWEVHTRPLTDSQRELAMEWMHKHLPGHLQDHSLRLAIGAVREFGQRATRIIEAQVLAEADSLDEIGPLALWHQVRRSSGEGRGLTAALETWQRQKEYHFWEARIKESFRFTMTRQLAEQRLRRMEQCFDLLAAQLRGDDLDRMLNSAKRMG